MISDRSVSFSPPAIPTPNSSFVQKVCTFPIVQLSCIKKHTGFKNNIIIYFFIIIINIIPLRVIMVLLVHTVYVLNYQPKKVALII